MTQQQPDDEQVHKYAARAEPKPQTWIPDVLTGKINTANRADKHSVNKASQKANMAMFDLGQGQEGEAETDAKWGDWT